MSIFDGAIFDPVIFDTGAVTPPAAVVVAVDSGAGSGKARRTDFWWELSTISFLARQRRRRKTPAQEIPAAVPVTVAELSVDEDEIDEIEEIREIEEINAIIFQANAEIASLEAMRATDILHASKFDQQIDRIKHELMRLREEEDILLIAMMD